jgi:alcohol dehydrogenase class IV
VFDDAHLAASVRCADSAVVLAKPNRRTLIAMHSFVYQALPSRVVFGAGALQQLGAEIDRLGAQRALVLSTPLAQAHGAPIALKAIGMPADGLDRAADLAVQNQYPNPRPLERAAIRELLQHAYDGTRPV